MKAFYLIHAVIIFEVILTILGVLKLQEFIFKIRKFGIKISKKASAKAQEIQILRKKMQSFNQNLEQKMNFAHNLNMLKNLLMDLSIQGLLKKFIFPKKSFFAKILNYKTTIFWFIASFWFFRKKSA